MVCTSLTIANYMFEDLFEDIRVAVILKIIILRCEKQTSEIKLAYKVCISKVREEFASFQFDNIEIKLVYFQMKFFALSIPSSELSLKT